MPFSPIPPDAVNVATRIVGEGQAQLDQIGGGDVGKIKIAVDDIKVDHHPPAPLDRLQMFWRKFNRVSGMRDWGQGAQGHCECQDPK